MKLFIFKLLRGIIYTLSLLPFWAVYAISDFLYVLVYYVVGYRRKTVRKNLRNSFPEKSKAQLRTIEREFYHSFCDNMVEMFKLISISPEEMRRRMTFSGNDDIEKSLEDHQFCFIYLGHFCNWEWISTMPMWFHLDKIQCGQLYHPVKSEFFDWLMLQLRGRFGAENIAKNDALRRIVSMRNDAKKTVIGFIADQGPRWVNIHEWVDFLNQDTPVYTGTERIAKKMNASVFFANVKRVKRGYYHCSLELVTNDPKSYPDYTLTDRYMQLLEAMIKKSPRNWLWTHNRWKRRHEDEPENIERRNEKESQNSAKA
jgi:Kdo2-lipid IVA lauroyltransferase/acyltransferase